MSNAPAKSPTWDAVKKTFRLLKQKSYWTLWRIFGVSLLSGLMDLTGLAVLLLYLRTTLSGAPSFLAPYIGGYSQEQIAIYGGAGTAVFILAKNVFSIFSNHLLNKFIFVESQQVTLQAYKYAMALPYIEFMKRTHNDFSASISGEIRRAYIAAAQPLIAMVRDVTIIFILMILIIFINPVITSLLSLMALFFLFLNIRFIRKHMMHLALKTESSIAESRKWLGYSLQSFVDIKLSGQNRFIEKYEDATKEDAYCQLKTKNADFIPLAQNEIILALSIIVITTYLAYSQDDLTGLFPILIIFAFAGLRILSLMGRIFIALKSISISSYLVEKVINLKNEIDAVESVERQQALEKAWDDKTRVDFETSINVKNLFYEYERATEEGKTSFSLQDISLTIPKGTFAGFVGPSGGGKTTLINLIIGLIPPDKGSVEWDGNSLNTPEKKVRFWKHVGYVSQHPVILPVSIRENITTSMQRHREVDDDKIWESLRLAQLDEFVRLLDDGLDTVLQGENASLSGGQRQRLVLARLFYNTPDIIILDEATSSLDNQTEHAVTQSIKELHKKGCTILCVAHRLSTIKNADTLFLLDKGTLVAQGTFESLLKTPLFKNLVEHDEIEIKRK